MTDNRQKLTLFLNTDAGYEILKYLLDLNHNKIQQIYLCSQYPKIDDKIIKLANKNDIKVFRLNGKEDANVTVQKNLEESFIISVYWPYLFNKSIIDKAIDSINFHPAYLPVNRGWYPHVHSIIDGSKIGVTLHQISEGADEGDIWAQKHVEYDLMHTAKDLYKKLQDEIIDLFKNNWFDIINHNIKPFPQDNSKSNYHKKNEINELDFIDYNNSENRKLINILRARSFGDKGFAYILDENGEKVYLNLRLSKNYEF